MFSLFCRERNKIYEEICNAKIDSEYFEEKTAQTISGAAKTKEVQCEKITVADKGKPGQDSDKRDFFNSISKQDMFPQPPLPEF